MYHSVVFKAMIINNHKSNYQKKNSKYHQGKNKNNRNKCRSFQSVQVIVNNTSNKMISVIKK